jgi:tetratricopeptide (TPR) repeat protein
MSCIGNHSKEGKIMKKLTLFLLALFLLTLVTTPVMAVSKEEMIKASYTIGVKAARHYFKTGKVQYAENARANFRHVLRLDSHHTGAMLMDAHIHLMQAKKLARKLSTEKFDKATGNFSLGNLFLSMGNFDEAIKNYDIAIAASPKWACPRRHKGEALLKANRNVEAITTLQECVKVRANHFDAHVYLAKAYLKNGQYADAEAETFKSMEIYKTSKGCNDDGEPEAIPEDCYQLLVDIYTATGDNKKARKYKRLLR